MFLLVAALPRCDKGFCTISTPENPLLNSSCGSVLAFRSMAHPFAGCKLAALVRARGRRGNVIAAPFTANHTKEHKRVDFGKTLLLSLYTFQLLLQKEEN